jgi:hypothetical protein
VTAAPFTHRGGIEELMTDHDMRALALNLAHSSERHAGDVLERAQKYYAFLSGHERVARSTTTATASAKNPYNGVTALEMQEAMHGALAR